MRVLLVTIADVVVVSFKLKNSLSLKHNEMHNQLYKSKWTKKKTFQFKYKQKKSKLTKALWLQWNN